MVKKGLVFVFLISSIFLLCMLPRMASDNVLNTVYLGQDVQDFSYDFTFVWMSDTQFYSQNYPYIFSNITDWIACKQDALNISYVIHTGDIVQNFYGLREWFRASTSMRQLDVVEVPYGVLAGNHDNGRGVLHIFFNMFFGKWRFYENGFFYGSICGNQNHYDLFSVNGVDFIVLYLSYGITSDEFMWAHMVLQHHRERHAIVAVHEYIKKGGDYSGQGEAIFDCIVVPHENVCMVLCGHKHDVELNTKIIDGRTIYEILANYQSEPLGGSGYIRLLHFSIKDAVVYVKTYSPYLDDFNYHDPEEDEFILPLILDSE